MGTSDQPVFQRISTWINGPKMCVFRMFGGAALDGEDGPLRGKAVQPRRIALLALLAIDPHHTLSRDKLIAYLWPDGGTGQGRHRLSEALYVLRQALGDGVLFSEGDRVRLDPDRLPCDATAFSAAMRNGDLEGAVSLYTGPFLDGFFLKGAPEFDRWMESERLSLSEEYGRALESLATAAQRDDAHLQAAEWWRRLAAHDPYNSRFALGLMHALTRAGDPGNALHHAREHTRFLKEELGIDPTSEFLAYAARLQSRDATRRPVAGGPSAARGVETPSVVGGGPEPPRPADEPGLAQSLTSNPGSRRKLWAGAIAVLATLLGVVVVSSSLTRDGGPVRISDLVVVPPFENRTGDPELDEVALLAAVWVEEAIEQVEGVRTVPSTFARHYAAQAAQAATGGSPHPVQAVAERANAGWAVGGVIRESGDSVEFRVEVIPLIPDRKTQRVIELGSRDALDVVIDRLARRVSGALAYEFDPIMEEQEKGSQPLPRPPTIEAFREHRLGYAAYDRGDWAASFQHHMAAVALDSTLVRAMVAAAFMAPDYAVRDSLAQTANQRRHLLSRKGQLDLDILLTTLAHDREGGLRAIREVARLEEGGFSSVLEAWFAMGVNRPRAALEATERYDPDLEWRRGEAHAYWRYRTQALHMLGEFEEELAEARRGRDRYPDRPDLLVSEVRASAALGRLEDVSSLLRQARALSDKRFTAASVAATELREHGFFDESRDAFAQAAGWLATSLPEEGLEPAEGLLMAEALYGAERWAEAREVAVGLLADSPDDPSALGMVGLTAARLGDPALASAVSDRLSDMSRPDVPGEHLYLMASISAVLNRPDKAMELLHRAFAEGLPHGLRLRHDMNFESLRGRGDFRALVTPKG